MSASRVSYKHPLEFQASGLTCKNRLVKAAMVEGMASISTGAPNERHYLLYRKWADCGFGMILSGNVIIDSTHMGTPGDLRAPAHLDEVTVDAWQRLAVSMTANDTIGILQLVHTGRQSARCAGRMPWVSPMGPSAVRVDSKPGNFMGKLAEQIALQTPREMTRLDIDSVVQQFVKGASLARRAGFHGVELHASHGYLLSSFLSPKANTRTDEFGGSPKKRLKILLDTISAVREVCPRPFLLGIKLNSADYVEGGLTEEEALLHIAELARQGGLDFIEISGGSYERVAFLEQPGTPSSRTRARESMFSVFCSQAKGVVQQAVREEAQDETGNRVVPVIMCTGGFKSAKGINQALDQDGVDLVGLGRAAAVDPELPLRLLQAGEGESDREKNESGVQELQCRPYEVTGGEWLTWLFPSKLVGASIQTLWHQFQMQRIARKEAPRLQARFETLLLSELLRGVKYLLAVVGSALCLSMVWFARSTPPCCAH